MKTELLRHIALDGYQLKLYDSTTADNRDNGRNNLAYEFIAPDGSILFAGEDFGSSPMDAIDSDNTLRSLLSFLTLRPGDTDAEYFENYTPQQMAFAQGDAEYLSLYALEPEDGQPNAQWTNLDGWDS